MHWVHEIVEWLELIIDLSAALIMVFAFGSAMIAYLKNVFKFDSSERIMQIQVMRCDLGVKLVFALELLIISDLLQTIASRSLDAMIILGSLVLIRTVISYFLNQEIQAISAEMKE